MVVVIIHTYKRKKTMNKELMRIYKADTGFNACINSVPIGISCIMDLYSNNKLPSLDYVAWLENKLISLIKTNNNG